MKRQLESNVSCTGRADRVGYYFDPNRATSGPMAYFTDNQEIAENYSKDKKDTSLDYDERYNDYHTQFRVKHNGEDISVGELWNTLSAKEKKELGEKAGHICFDDDYETIIYNPDVDYGMVILIRICSGKTMEMS